MQGKVEICGVNTSKLAVLDSATTRRLLLRVRQGDKSAREELIAGNLRLVLSVIQRFSSRGENIDDLFQVGASVSSRPSTTSTPRRTTCAFPPTACR